MNEVAGETRLILVHKRPRLIWPNEQHPQVYMFSTKESDGMRMESYHIV